MTGRMPVEPAGRMPALHCLLSHCASVPFVEV
jgi:hypothetical protein